MTEQVKTLAELKADADELGIEYQPNWGAKKLKAAIADAEAKLDISADEGDEPEQTPDADVKDDTTDEPNDDDEEPELPPVDAGTMRLLNTGRNPHAVGHDIVAPGEGIDLTKEQLKDDRLMAKIKTSIRCGVLVEVE